MICRNVDVLSQCDYIYSKTQTHTHTHMRALKYTVAFSKMLVRTFKTIFATELPRLSKKEC